MSFPAATSRSLLLRSLSDISAGTLLYSKLRYGRIPFARYIISIGTFRSKATSVASEFPLSVLKRLVYMKTPSTAALCPANFRNWMRFTSARYAAVHIPSRNDPLKHISFMNGLRAPPQL